MGMNYIFQPFTGQQADFNPHPRMGMPCSQSGSCAACDALQPTPPHGDERNNLIKNQLYRIFNSHPVRDEPIGLQLALDMYYFNSHPRMGMNEHGVVLSDIKITFQPTSPHGDELMSLHSYTPEFITTHTPAWG